ncbi:MULTISPECIES: hypothetical protein [unclassified Sphingomonas]|uniref:hypothetical protein n=1 Tax=unclassified Sphingomonas TaxID=196159 RepID=UPI000BC52449|nr:MAG: hypothetical protein B7Z43_06135 [Sphingomonas sp. 12-62-6]OYX37342.1 MAG: hypothetical protein B7Y98_12875 [Sphingomonas sp. 32-62-10]
MSDDPVAPPAPEVTAETVAIRRRWLSLGEAVAVAGVIIGGLTFWNSFEERRDAREIRAEERAAAREAALAAARRTGLIATEADGSKIAFKGVDCALQSTDIRFPKPLGVSAQSTVTVHEFEAAWIARPLLKLTDGGDDRRQGRLPVLIDSLCTGPEGNRQESAIYDIAWRIEPALLGRSLKLRGMVMRQRITGSSGQATLDALWTKP